jgi:hypothetical protein
MPADLDSATPRALEEIIDPKDTVCVPRYTCAKSRTQDLDPNLPYTDNINNVSMTVMIEHLSTGPNV